MQPHPPTAKRLGTFSTLSIGIGGMVGGGIFAVTGLTIEVTKGAAPIAFLIAGLVALLTSYSYLKLTLAFPGEGGIVDFAPRSDRRSPDPQSADLPDGARGRRAVRWDGMRTAPPAMRRVTSAPDHPGHTRRPSCRGTSSVTERSGIHPPPI